MNSIYLSDSAVLTKFKISSIFSISDLFDMVITSSVGALNDKMKRKKPLPITAVMLFMLGLLLYMRADSFISALIGMILAVAPSGLIMGQLFAMARNHFMRLAPNIFEIVLVCLRDMNSVL